MRSLSGWCDWMLSQVLGVGVWTKCLKPIFGASFRDEYSRGEPMTISSYELAGLFKGGLSFIRCEYPPSRLPWGVCILELNSSLCRMGRGGSFLFREGGIGSSLQWVFLWLACSTIVSWLHPSSRVYWSYQDSWKWKKENKKGNNPFSL